MAELKRTELSVKQEQAILVGVILPGSLVDRRDPLGELEALARTAGAKVVGRTIQKRARIDASTYIGSGKALEIARMAGRLKADVVIFDNDLSPGQIGALEKLINEEIGSLRGRGVKVLDRSELILDIFATRARTAEAKLQVELAQMEYTYPRLTRMWGHLERIASGAGPGIGTRGPGEMQLEIDRRLVRRRVAELRREMARIQQRKSRTVARRTAEHFTVCIVGYTNAGKSTLFNALTDGGAYADDRLFATLDTRTRAWRLERGIEVLLSDTVGFVRDLPHHLVASFRATLEETIHADLLLHVLDVGHPQAERQFESVHKVLADIGAGGKPELLLLNKIDTPEGEAAWPAWRTLHPDAIAISARTGAGLDELRRAVLETVRGQRMEVELEADCADGRLLAFIESRAEVLQRSFAGGAAVMRAIVGRRTLESLARKAGITVRRAVAAADSTSATAPLPSPGATPGPCAEKSQA